MKRRLDFICKNEHISLDQVVTEDNFLCPVCQEPTETYWSGVKVNVIGDDIPGGIEIKHAICWPDGTPKKYYSKSEIKKAAADAGYTMADETPKMPSHVADRKWKEAEAKGRNWI